MENKQEQEYVLLVLKTTGEILEVLNDEDYDKVHKGWQELLTRWKTSLDEKAPFELLQPYVTAFDPGTITEIKILPRVKSTQAHNPYQKEMRQKGFSQTFPKANTDLLDEGYKI